MLSLFEETDLWSVSILGQYYKTVSNFSNYAWFKSTYKYSYLLLLNFDIQMLVICVRKKGKDRENLVHEMSHDKNEMFNDPWKEQVN